tara:strand:+ start:255 stop:656 length:402 start_codon:yes stop_codon:yes gene_type:complete
LKSLGIQILLDLEECDPILLDDITVIKNLLRTAAFKGGAAIVGESFHKFNPLGVTGVISIAESHIFIHTWPEHSYAAVDIFSCGNSFDAEVASKTLTVGIKSKKQTVTRINRGLRGAHSHVVDVENAQEVHYE